MCFEGSIALKRKYSIPSNALSTLKKTKVKVPIPKYLKKDTESLCSFPDAIDVYNWYLICTNISLTAMTTYRYLLLHAELKVKSMTKWFIDIIIRYRNHHTTSKHWWNHSSGLLPSELSHTCSGTYTISDELIKFIIRYYYITSDVLHGLKNNH